MTSDIPKALSEINNLRLKVMQLTLELREKHEGWKRSLTPPPRSSKYDRGWWLADCCLSCWARRHRDIVDPLHDIDDPDHNGLEPGHAIEAGEPVYFSGEKGAAYCEMHVPARKTKTKKHGKVRTRVQRGRKRL